MAKCRRIIPYLFLTLIFLAGCSKGPQFDKASINMSLSSLQSAYPGLQRLDDIKDKQGGTVLVFQRPSDDNVKKAQYYVKDDKLIGMVVIFPKGTAFDSVVRKLAEENGEPDRKMSVMGSQAATWEKGGSAISVITAVSGTQIGLPSGGTEKLEPGEILLFLGKQ